MVGIRRKNWEGRSEDSEDQVEDEGGCLEQRYVGMGEEESSRHGDFGQLS